MRESWLPHRATGSRMQSPGGPPGRGDQQTQRKIMREARAVCEFRRQGARAAALRPKHPTEQASSRASAVSYMRHAGILH